MQKVDKLANTNETRVHFHYVIPLKNHCRKTFFSDLVDVKTGWNVRSWPCIQPKHCRQRDGYNCGVYVCFVSRSQPHIQCLFAAAPLEKTLGMRLSKNHVNFLEVTA